MGCSSSKEATAAEPPPNTKNPAKEAAAREKHQQDLIEEQRQLEKDMKAAENAASTSTNSGFFGFGGGGSSDKLDDGKNGSQKKKPKQRSFRKMANAGITRAVKTSLKVFHAQPKIVGQVTSAAIVMSKQVTKGAHHLKNVFAVPLTVGLDDLLSFRAPVIPKSQEEQDFIREALKQNFVFSTASEKEYKTFIGAFEQVETKLGDAIITQGEQGDYFYILRRGVVRYEVNNEVVGKAETGASFGELALLYTSPRAASVIADSDCVLYRVDQKTFRYILHSQTAKTENDKKELLNGVTFLQDLDPTDVAKLVHTMTPRKFEKDEYLVRKGEEGDTFYVIQEGQVRVTDITVGMTNYEDQTLGAGDYFGERSLITKEPRSANCIGNTKGIALCIDKDTFETVVGNLSALILKSADKRKLAAIKLIQQSQYPGSTLSTLASKIIDRTYEEKNAEVIAEGAYTPAALYLVREGAVEIESRSLNISSHIVNEGGYFGEEMLKTDVGGLQASDEIIAEFSVRVVSDKPVVLGVLTLRECRKIIDTTSLGTPQINGMNLEMESNITLASLTKHTILGAGTFGQVWLVSTPGTPPHPYALKIQSKYELISSSQAKGVMQERNLMAQLNTHPFLIHLVQTYQDKRFLYMLLRLVQGGELFSLLHQPTHDGIDEPNAKFYSACILEGLTHMHRRNILYRDLKPENVLIDGEGYAVIVDLGFAKYVPHKTYTLCGTPLYLAPEVILNRGHDKGADHWSYGVLTFEMIAGFTPFYMDGMDQITLFRFIVNSEYRFPPEGIMSAEVEDLLQRLFVTEPAKRLGSLAGGVEEIFEHAWFREYDFDILREKKYESPWVPEIKDPLDNSNFEDWNHLEDKTIAKDPPLSAEEQKIFENF